MTSILATIPEALEDLRQGKMLILIDDEKRENEGDLMCAAQHVTPEQINFMTQYGRGLVCLSLAEEIVERLELPMMAPQNSSRFGTPFTVSIEAKEGVTTGISAFDRAHTIRVAVDPHTCPTDLARPGHIFPLRAKPGGVLERPGQTEGSVDLAKMAGLTPAAVICEIMNADGTMARLPDLAEFAKRHQLKIVSVNDLIAYRLQHERLITEVAHSLLPLEPHGMFTIRVFENKVDHYQHLALIAGTLHTDKPVLVRLHSECLTGDTFGSARCDCGQQLDLALAQIAKEGGVLVYLRQEGRGIGLANKIKAYALQDQGCDTVEANYRLGFSADQRNYSLGAQILHYLGIKQVRLLTNNPQKIHGLTGHGIEVVARKALPVPVTALNQAYLRAKQEKLGHLLEL